MRTDVRERVAGAVRAEVARRQITRPQIASAIGVSLATVGRRLAGEQDFTVTELAEMADLLDVPLLRLLDDVSPRAVAA